MKRRGTALLLAATVVLAAATAALADAGRVADEVVSTVLPVTPAQAREIATLLRAPGTVAVDVVDTTDAVVDTVAALPAGLLHDVVTTPVRHWHVVRGLVADTVEIVARPPGNRSAITSAALSTEASGSITIGGADITRLISTTWRNARR